MDLDRRLLLAMGLLALPSSRGTASGFEFDKRQQPKPAWVMIVPRWSDIQETFYVKQIVGCIPEKWHVEYVTDVRFAARLPLDTHSASLTCAANAVKKVGGMAIEFECVGKYLKVGKNDE